MSFAEVRQTLLRDFLLCVENEQVPPLSGYLAEYVKSGCSVVAGDYRLVPLTASSLRYTNSSSNCLTDCMIDLQSKYQELVPDDAGGHLERGRREICVIGFNVLEGVVLDILEIDQTTSYLDWAEPKLDSLHWERLLIHAVVDFGRSCQASQIRLQPAHRHPVAAQVAADPATAAAFRQKLKQRYDDSAGASGFAFDHGMDCFVLDLGAK